MRQFYRTLLCAVLFSVVPITATAAGATPAASGLPYNTLELDYGFHYFGDGEIQIKSDKAYRAKGSYVLSDSLYMVGSFDQRKFRINSTNLDLTFSGAGLGMYFPASPLTDFFVEATYSEQSFKDSGAPDAKGDGFSYAGGIRMAPSKAGEFTVGYRRTSYDMESSGGDYKDKFSGLFGSIALNISPEADLVLEFDSTQLKSGTDSLDLESYLAGVRLRF